MLIHEAALRKGVTTALGLPYLDIGRTGWCKYINVCKMDSIKWQMLSTLSHSKLIQKSTNLNTHSNGSTNICFEHSYMVMKQFTINLTLKRPGGGLNQPPPQHFPRPFRRANFLTAPLADFLLSSLAHLMTPFSRKSGIPLRRCTTFYTSSSDQKWLKNVILCTKSMQMEFSHLIHKDMIIFTFIGWNQFILA